jgi:PKD repeat protein
LTSWTNSPAGYTFTRRGTDEGEDTAVGQVGDICFLQVSDSQTYMYYIATSDGSSSAGQSHIKMASAGMSIADVAASNEDYYVIDTNKWDTHGTVALINGYVKVGGADYSYIISKSPYGINTSFSSSLQTSHSAGNGYYIIAGYWANPLAASKMVNAYPSGETTSKFYNYNTGYGGITMTGWSTAWSRLEGKRNATGVAWSVNNGADQINTNQYPTDNILFVPVYANSNTWNKCNWTFMRTYRYPEPSMGTWGGESANPVFAPVVNFTGTPLIGGVPLLVSFTDISTNSPISWQWNFGDGSANSTSQNPTHSYSTGPGLYDVTLTASNQFGSDTEQKIEYINVTGVTPTPTPTVTPTGTGNATTPVQGPAQPGRISPLGFVLLATIDFGLFFYALVDNENRNYFHIIACIAAVIVSFLCGTFLITGYITEDFVVTNIEASVNESVISTYSVHQAQIIDAGFGYFFMFIGVVMLIIGVLASIEAFREFSSEAGGDFE